METICRLCVVLFASLFFHKYPLFFMALVIWMSQRSLSRLELDKGIHEMQFYLTKPISHRLQRLYSWYCKCETFFRSIALSCLALFLFGGTETDRIAGLSFWFTFCVGVAVYMLRWVQNHTSIQAMRWGYTRMSIAMGILYSLLASLVPGIRLSDIAYRAGSSGWWRTFSVADTIEIAYGSLFHLNQFIQDSLSALLGSFIGGFLSIFISVNIVYGFLIFVTAAFLLDEKPHRDAANVS